ncbi:MAG: DUF2085 domain-containing protein [Anaerolineales bacterium]|nr:DUF2085 domain-containing protein [Anaerolineales bacterium]
MLIVTLYTRKGCKLCEQTRADLEAIRVEIPHVLVEVDISVDPSLENIYGSRIPVVEVGPYTREAPISRQDLVRILGAARDRQMQLEEVDGDIYQSRVQRGMTITRADKVMYWIARHYLAMINFIILLYFGLPFLAPVFMKTGAVVPARVIYTIYSPLCHQFAFRSWFLFGDQSFYPREVAGIEGVKSFEEVTGITDQVDPVHWQARNYVGDEVIGYKTALCERDVAIYGAMFVFGLLFAATGRKLRPLHWLLWIALGMAPIGFDGFSQVLSQMGLPFLQDFLPYRESTPLLRTLTGFMFGFSTAWLLYPYIQETMQENIQFFVKKFAVAAASSK